MGESEKLNAFVCEIEAVCKKYNLSISHEDYQGCFVIEPFYDENIIALKCAIESYLIK